MFNSCNSFNTGNFAVASFQNINEFQSCKNNAYNSSFQYECHTTGACDYYNDFANVNRNAILMSTETSCKIYDLYLACTSTCVKYNCKYVSGTNCWFPFVENKTYFYCEFDDSFSYLSLEKGIATCLYLVVNKSKTCCSQSYYDYTMYLGFSSSNTSGSECLSSDVSACVSVSSCWCDSTPLYSGYIDSYYCPVLLAETATSYSSLHVKVCGYYYKY